MGTTINKHVYQWRDKKNTYTIEGQEGHVYQWRDEKQTRISMWDKKHTRIPIEGKNTYTIGGTKKKHIYQLGNQKNTYTTRIPIRGQKTRITMG